MPGHHHRSSTLKQANKKNKRSKSSKRSLTRVAGGKINRRVHNGQATFAQSKADRRNKLQQKRETKKEALLRQKRGAFAGGPLPPRVVGIISLGTSEDIEGKLRTAILEGADKKVNTLESNEEATVTCKFDVHKKEGSLTVLTNSTAFSSQYHDSFDPTDGTVQAALDLCRVCDMVVFIVDGDESKMDNLLEMQIGGDDISTKTSKSQTGGQNWDHLISERGDRILNAIKGQGMPSILTVLAHTVHEDVTNDYMSVKSTKSIRRSQTKRALNLKKYVSRFATTEFGPNNDSVVEVDISHLDETEQDMELNDAEGSSSRSDILALVRTLCTKAASPSKWVAQAARPYILSDDFQYNTAKQELHISGFIRGRVPFNVNSLVHIPGLGTYGCKSMKKCTYPLSRRGKDSMDAVESSLLVADPSKRESLEMFATPDALEGEQNLVGFDESHDHDSNDDDVGMDGDDAIENNFSRPAGWSDYQSAWLDAVDDDGDDGGFDHGELAKELNKKSTASVADFNNMDLDDANNVTAEERKELLEKRKKEQSDDLEFPDEVQVDDDLLARDRFARYRSLKSFRKTYWDPKENLPDSYGNVFHFSNFKATQRSVMRDMRDLTDEAAASNGNFGLTGTITPQKDIEMGDESEEEEDFLSECAPCGSYVTMTIEGVAQAEANLLSMGSLLTAVGLLPHENKVAVLHAGLCHSTGCSMDEELPVKSKDTLTFRCGWRTWKARPVFSQNNLNCGKHKFERFMPPQGAFFAASFFGPVSYAPCPVLVFREQKGKAKELCAIGSMMGADADRIVVKRIMLTGYPVRVHKRHATVKYMFYNPEDVKWFKPAGLTTKHGLQGNIIESVGDHGTMKCLFNAPISQADTVICALYKRVYPKYAIAGIDGDGASRSIKPGGKPELIVR